MGLASKLKWKDERKNGNIVLISTKSYQKRIFHHNSLLLENQSKTGCFNNVLYFCKKNLTYTQSNAFFNQRYTAFSHAFFVRSDMANFDFNLLSSIPKNYIIYFLKILSGSPNFSSNCQTCKEFIFWDE